MVDKAFDNGSQAITDAVDRAMNLINRIQVGSSYFRNQPLNEDALRTMLTLEVREQFPDWLTCGSVELELGLADT